MRLHFDAWISSFVHKLIIKSKKAIGLHGMATSNHVIVIHSFISTLFSALFALITYTQALFDYHSLHCSKVRTIVPLYHKLFRIYLQQFVSQI